MTPVSTLLARGQRIALYSLASLLALWALAWLAVPSLLKSQIESRGSAALGRTLTVGAVDFKPWSLELTLRDLAIASADGSTPQFTVAQVYVDAELQSLLRGGPVLDAVVLESPALQLTRTASGHYDVDDIVTHLTAASPAPSPPSAPLRFALYNLELRNGAVHFNDLPVARQHVMRQLHITVPFLSNLDATRDATVAPHLAFELNGSAFDSAAKGTPFAQTRKGEVHVAIAHMDMAPYLPYWPADLPVQARSAVLDTDLRATFVQGAQAALSLSGKVKLSNLQLVDAAGAALLGVDAIEAKLADVRPLERVAKLASLEITSPQLWAGRNPAGRLNWDFSATKSSVNASKNIAASARPASANSQKSLQNNGPQKDPATAAAAPPPWRVELAHLTLTQGRIHWADDSTRPKAQAAVTALALTADALRWPLDAAAPARFSGALVLQAKGSTPAQLQFDGQGSDQSGTLHAKLANLALYSAAPYLAQFLTPQLSGTLDADGQAQWKPEGIALALQRLTLRDTALHAGAATDWPQFKALELRNAQIDLGQRRMRVESVALRAPRVQVQRDADGRWMVQTWLPTAPAEVPPGPTSAPAAAAPATPPWSVAVDTVSLRDGALGFVDLTTPRRVRLALSDLNVELRHATLDGKQPAPLTLTARLKAGRTEPGTLAFTGNVMWDPVRVQGRLDAQDLPMHALSPYIADQLNLDLLRADTSFKGQVQYAKLPAGTQLSVQGDGALGDFRANSVLSSAGDLQVGEELLSWKALNLPGLELAMAPGTATQFSLREASLSDFFARVIVRENGRINLQDLVKKAPPPTANPSTHPTEIPQAAASAATSAASVDSAAASTAAATASTAPDAIIHIGPISLVQGKVLFSDRFIQPHYSADLSELTGRLSGFSSVTEKGVVQLADLEVRGRAEGSAQLEITGKLNPLARPLALDIQGHVRDLELPPLSPYAVKYAGYGITRGKLSVDVGYTLAPNGQLSATNKLVLNQLTFGDKVEGAPANLPVKLAVALLADRNGVIDVNLPISGSLNDPDFKLGSVVFKLIGNLIVKAASAPFSLLTTAFGGGGEELSSVFFAPGSSALTPEAKAGLDKVARALADRPGLTLTVTGAAALDAEREALKRARLNDLLQSEKRRRATSTSTADPAGASDAISEAQYQALLKTVYRRADMVKPRNALGLAQSLSVADMEALLMANIRITEDAAQALALQRGVTVKDYLISQKLAAQRLYLGGAQLVTPDAQWKPHAVLGLSNH